MKIKIKAKRMMVSIANAYRPDGYANVVDVPRPLWVRARAIHDKRSAALSELDMEMEEMLRKRADG